MLSEQPIQAAERLIGQNATLSLSHQEAQNPRYFNGFVCTLKNSLFPNTQGLFELKLNLVSWMNLLNLTHNSRIFQNLSVLSILKELLKEHPLFFYDSTLLQKHYATIPYCVQYQESDTGFIKRLLAGAGIVYYFKHELGKHTLILIDHPSGYTSHAKAELRTQSWETCHSSFGTSIKAHSAHLDCAPGLFFQQDRSYVITQVIHFAENQSHQTQSRTPLSSHNPCYRNRVWARAADQLYRPRLRSKPRVAGLQSAWVYGPLPQTVHSSDHASIQLQYPWNNRKEEPIHWVRSLQKMAGNHKAWHCLPRTGTEVLVSFQEGDPESPLICANCTHADQPPLFNSPEALWKLGFKSQNSSELSFDHQPGAEKIRLYAQQDLIHSIQGEQNLQIQQHYSLKVGQDFNLSAEECYQLKAQDIEVKAGESTISLKADSIQIQGVKVRLN